MSETKPTLRELHQLKQDYRSAPHGAQAQRGTWQRYQDTGARAGLLTGLAACLAD